MAQKYTAAKQAANRRYDSKTYKVFSLYLRVEDDADIIASLEEAKEQGVPTREWLKEVYEASKGK